MSRKPVIAGNWKMNLTHLEGIQLVQNLAYHLDSTDFDKADVAVIPPFTSLRSIQTLIEGDRLDLTLGAQSCHHETSGAYTGEISPTMLSALGCSWVIAGHSERRTLFGETDEVVNAKVKAIIAAEMTPILCVGETLEQREAGEAEAVIRGQVTGSLAGVSAEQVADLVIAYEPIWAIGTGRTALPSDADGGCATVRATVAELHGTETAEAVRIQYGGSVKPGNVAELMSQPNIDGALVGGASLNADDFAVIARFHRL
ncbi:Triosephosphate isomerase [Euzebya pacifica]|uniref:Triosephosphate isomerase n=1 Tax=Euzebya pacifica TaxID=1608957 RepID=A0A346XYA6_9ACTN|nr:triose-phosphate isomerase [Euzebya pacifica]AXV07203.1 Triosephosphate isomerase [Euzebya pacifica]